MKRFVYSLLTIVGVLACVSCRHEQPHYVIGVSQCLDDAWRQRMNAEMERELVFHPEIQLTFRTAYGSNERQCAQIDSLISEHVDLLIVSPNEAAAVQPAVSRAYRKGIPVIVADRRVEGDEWTAFIGGNNHEVGLLLGEQLCALAEQRTEPLHVLEVTGLKGSTPAVLRHVGLLEKLQQTQKVHYEGIAPAYWFEEPARVAVDSALRANPAINTIVAQNDLMARGARTAADEIGRKDIYILGVDAMGGPRGGLQAIIDGIIDASATYASRGDMVIECASAILHGQPFVRDTVLQSALIDRSNARLMLSSSNRMDHEVETVKALHVRAEEIYDRYILQRMLTYTTSALLVLLICLVIIMILVFRYRQRVARERAQKEALLSHQADQLQAITEELARTKAALEDEEKFMRRLQKEIERHLSDTELDVENLSDKLGVSRASLYRKIKAATGNTPSELLRHIRLAKAKQLIQETDLTIQQITCDVGFSSPSYFSKCYHKEFGINPKEETRHKKSGSPH